jgi:hypothetical protein
LVNHQLMNYQLEGTCRVPACFGLFSGLFPSVFRPVSCIQAGADLTAIGMQQIRTFHQSWFEPLPGGDLGGVQYAITRQQWLAQQALPGELAAAVSLSRRARQRTDGHRHLSCSRHGIAMRSRERAHRRRSARRPAWSPWPSEPYRKIVMAPCGVVSAACGSPSPLGGFPGVWRGAVRVMRASGRLDPRLPGRGCRKGTCGGARKWHPGQRGHRGRGRDPAQRVRAAGPGSAVGGDRSRGQVTLWPSDKARAGRGGPGPSNINLPGAGCRRSTRAGPGSTITSNCDRRSAGSVYRAMELRLGGLRAEPPGWRHGLLSS